MKKFSILFLAVIVLLFSGCEKDKNTPESESKPTLLEEVYLKGFCIYRIPRGGTNYKFSFIGTKQSFVEIDPFRRETYWTDPLYNSQLPKTFTMVGTPFICERINMIDYIYFTCAVKYYADSKPEGVKCLEERHYINDESFIIDRPDEIIFTSTDGKTKIGVLFEYK